MVDHTRGTTGSRRLSRFSATPFQLTGPESSRDEILLSMNLNPDIKFIVEGHVIEAYSELLARASPVFKAMFFGSFKTQTVIEISDSTAAAFELVLKTIYGDFSVFKNASFQLCMECFMIAHKYNLQLLERTLSIQIHKLIDVSNVFEILILAKHVSMPYVLSKCWSVIERNTKKAINSKGFIESVDWDTLCDILENNHLTVREFELAMAVWRWCQRKLQSSKRWWDNSLHGVLGVAVYKIRFPLMTKKEFGFICTTGMLKDGEVDSLRKNFRKNLVFKTTPRRNVCMCKKAKTSICPLCINKVLPKPYELYKIRTDLNNNKPGRNQRSPAFQIDSICDCQKYLSCPSFPNGASARILNARKRISV